MNAKHPRFPWPASEAAGVVGFIVGVLLVYLLVDNVVAGLLAGAVLGAAGAALRHPGAALAYTGVMLVTLIAVVIGVFLRPASLQSREAATGPGGFTPQRLRFFESGREHPALNEREFAGSFDAASTRFVCWHLDATYPETQRRIAIRIDYRYVNPDGSLLGEAQHATHLEQGWVKSWHSRCWGWDEPGRWAPGIYRVALSLQGDDLIKGSFTLR